MPKLILLIAYFMLLAFGARAQERGIVTEELAFDSPVEESLWEKGNEQHDAFYYFLAVRPTQEPPVGEWESLIDQLDRKFEKKGNSLGFIRFLFQKAHQKLLKEYEQHATFSQLLESGKFDCVSGTAVLGLLLDRYGFQFELIETDYHVFSIVSLDGNQIILESTLQIGGMITNPSEVKKYIDSYKPSPTATYLSLNQRIGSNEVDYSDQSVFRRINLKKLAGLQYYNDAIYHFNRQAFRISEKQLAKAYHLYPSERIEGLHELTIDQAYKTSGLDLSQR